MEKTKTLLGLYNTDKNNQSGNDHNSRNYAPVIRVVQTILKKSLETSTERHQRQIDRETSLTRQFMNDFKNSKDFDIRNKKLHDFSLDNSRCQAHLVSTASSSLISMVL